MATDRAVIVHQKTRLTGLIERFNTLAQARFYLEHLGEDIADYEREDAVYRAALDRVAREVARHAPRLQRVEKAYLPTFLFTPGELVVVVGRDGLVVNTAKYLETQPMIAVNPDPERWDGVLLPFRPDTVGPVVGAAAAGDVRCRNVTMAEARFGDGQHLLAVNDFIVGLRGHASARYRLSWHGRSEEQSSSGVLVSTPAGSTGWLRSTQAMATAINRFALGPKAPKPGPLRLDWEERRLVFVVREPFPSRSTGTDLGMGWIEDGETLELTSRMPDGGIVFSDGMEADAVAFGAGTTVRIGVSERRARLVVPA